MNNTFNENLLALVHIPESASIQTAKGVVLRPLFGEQVSLSYVSFAPHSVAPIHKHHHEQISFVLEGRLEIQVGNENKLLGPGDALIIPSNMNHGAVSLEEGCICIEAFAPPREDLKELLRQDVE